MTYEEMLLLNIMGLSSLQPHYWSEFIMLAERLLTPQEREVLNQMIFDVEKMVLETEIVPEEEENEKGEKEIVWVERIRGELSLYDIEMAFESLPDYYSYFQKEDGVVVTKFDVERRLDKIRKWIFERVGEKAAGRRFTRMR